MSGHITYQNCPVCNSTNIHRLLDVKDHSISKEIFAIWQCEDCKLRFTQGIPSADSIGRYYQSEDYISHSDTKKGLVSRMYHAVRNITLVSKRKLVSTYSGKSSGRILDLGCGTGAFLNEMKHAGWQVTGIEPDAHARQKAKELYHIEALPAEKLYEQQPASFDVISLWHVLEHVHDLHEYIEHINQLLKPGGLLVIAVPNYTSADAAHYHYFWAAYDVPRHLYHFSPSSMEKLMKQHGLSVQKELPMWFDAFYVSMLSEKYRHNSMPVLKGGMKGAWFNLQTAFNRRKCSSLIYLVKK